MEKNLLRKKASGERSVKKLFLIILSLFSLATIYDTNAQGAGAEINVVSPTAQQSSGSTYRFANQNVFTTSPPVTFTIQNNGSQPLSITTPLMLSGTNSSQYEIVEQPASSIPSGSTSSFKVVFKPTSTFTKNATVTILNNDSDEGTYEIKLQGLANQSTPTFTSFTPEKASPGSTITISGTNLQSVNQVIFFENIPALPELVNNQTLTVKVPSNASTGIIRLKYNTASYVSSTSELTVVVLTPTISNVDPNIGAPGALVTITGTNLAETESITINGTEAPFFVDTDETVYIEVPLGATSGPLVLTTPHGSAQAQSDFTVVAPIIESFSPSFGPVGTEVIVRGANFSTPDNAGALLFRNSAGAYIPATDYRLISTTEIRGKVPSGAVTGPIAVKDEYGQITESSINFTVTLPPTITELSPDFAPIGTEITVLGTNFENIQSITFNGKAAITYNRVNANSLKVTVPQGATSGPLVVTTLGGTAQRNFTVDSAPLPVELVAFTAKATTQGTVLTWQTASEQDNDYFEVESSSNPTKEGFKAIQRVDSKVTNSQVLTSYEAEDRNPAGKVTYYRLKQVDLDGKFEYSKTISVQTKAVAQTASPVKVYPNPFIENLSIEVAAKEAGQLNVALYYVTGKKAFEKVVTVEAGVSTVEIALESSRLASGMYILSTELNGEVNTTRVIKK